jgi:hypothetical protein
MEQDLRRSQEDGCRKQALLTQADVEKEQLRLQVSCACLDSYMR